MTTDNSKIRTWILRAFGAILLLLGAVLTIGGVKLAMLEGSLYYAIIGVVLIASGALIFFRRVFGSHLYFIAFAATLIW